MRNYYHQIYDYIEKLTYMLIAEDKRGGFSFGESLQLMDLLLLRLIDSEKEISIQKLVAETGLKRNDISSMVNRLTAKKMLHKENDGTDRRVKELSLTERGKNILLQFREEEQNRLFELLNEFTFNEEKAILKFLVKIEMKYREAGKQ